MMKAALPPRWAYLLFGVLEPIIDAAAACAIYAPGTESFFSDATLAVRLCIGLCQVLVWHRWCRGDPMAPGANGNSEDDRSDAGQRRWIRTWAWTMLLRDSCEYGAHLRIGRLDATSCALLGMRASLTIGRIALLVALASGARVGSGPVGAALQGAIDYALTAKIDRSLPSDLRLDGVSFALTGASRGLGLAIARALARCGASLTLLVRSRPAETARTLAAEPGATGAIRAVHIDLESLASVDAAVAQMAAQSVVIHRLVLNAGMLPNSSRLSPDGVDVMLQTNFLANVRLVERMIASGVLRVDGPTDALADASRRRIVIIGSEAHRSSSALRLSELSDDLPPRWSYGLAGVLSYYGLSKLYLHTWACTLARRLDGGATDVYHLCPGAIASDIGREAPSWARPLLHLVMAIGFQSPQTAAAPAVWCAASPDAAGRNGLYLHLGRERAPSQMARDVDVGNQLWKAVHALLQRMESRPGRAKK